MDYCVDCERKCHSFKHLSAKELEKVHANKVTIKYHKRETIVKQGSQFNQIISFNQGLAKIHIHGKADKDIILGIIRPSQIIAGPGFFYDHIHSFSVTALTDSVLCLIDSTVFKEVFKSNGNFAEHILSDYSKMFLETYNRLLNLTQKQMHGRIADALMYLSNTPNSNDPFDLLLSRQELAEFTGLSKETVSRIINQFKEEKIIETKGRLTIINDWTLLQKINNAG